MKIFIRTLLLIVPVFLHFGELNAAEPGEASTNRASRKRGRPQGRRIIQPRVPDPNDGPADIIVHYGEIEIQVWLDRLLRVRKAIYPNNYIPQAAYYIYNNFLIRTIDLNGVILVAYKNQEGELIGVRGPKISGQGYTLEPNPSEWYIIYCAKHFKLAVKDSVVYDISLMPENVHGCTQHSFETVKVAGIQFKVFIGPTGVITGAELDFS